MCLFKCTTCITNLCKAGAAAGGSLDSVWLEGMTVYCSMSVRGMKLLMTDTTAWFPVNQTHCDNEFFGWGEILCELTNKGSHLSSSPSNRVYCIRLGSIIKKLLTNIQVSWQSSKMKCRILMFMMPSIGIGPLIKVYSVNFWKYWKNYS